MPSVFGMVLVIFMRIAPGAAMSGNSSNMSLPLSSVLKLVGGRNVDKNSSTFFAEAPLGNVMLDFWGCAAG
mgnify:FL=1